MHRLFATLTIVLLTSAAHAQVPRFVVQTTNGSLPAASLTMLADDWTLRTAGADGRLVAGKQLVSLTHASLPRPDLLDTHFLLLTNGDRIPVDTRSKFKLEEDLLYFTPATPLESSSPIAIPINYCQMLWLETPKHVLQRGQYLRDLLRARTSRDTVVLLGGDRLQGRIAGGDGGLQLKSADRIRDMENWAIIVFTSELRATPRSRRAWGHVVLADGSRIGFSKLRYKDEVFTGRTLFGANVSFPANQLRDLQLRGGAATYLSDLTPADYTFTPYLDVHWPLAVDQNARNRPMRLGPDTFDKGLGMHPRCQATYKLDGKYRWFEAIVGLDAVVGRKGRVRIDVLVDGKSVKLHEAERTDRDPPIPLRINVGKARTLTLVVDFGNFADVQAHVNWANARVIK